MTPLESSLSDTTVWSVILELSIMILEVIFTLIDDDYSTGITSRIMFKAKDAVL
jgi:hypothetical protein